ncbi:MAG: hypothetical protein JWP74_1546 [Marmoricola sp.]|nr:hypothetical protein [Marmoricola sp.]
MTRTLAGLLLAATVVLGLPAAASASATDPGVFVSSTSYAHQPRTYTAVVFNNLDNSRVSATISNVGIGSRAMSCRAAGAIKGLGTWHCSFSGGRLSPGSVSVSAHASGGGHSTRTVTRSANVSSAFGISSHTASVNAGQSFQVRGSYDHVSGASDFSVHATVTSGGSVVLGQSGSSCSLSGSSYTCTLSSSSTGAASATYSVSVTESGGHTSRSASTSVQVVGASTPIAPAKPTFTSPHKVAVAKQPLVITGRASAGGLKVQLLVDPSGALDWSHPTATCTTRAGGGWSCKLPESFPAGKHRIVARVIDPAHPTLPSAPASYTVVLKGATPSTTATATPTPTPTPTATPTEAPPTTTTHSDTPRSGGSSSSDRNHLLALLILALALITVARPRTMSAITTGSSVAFSDEDAEETLAYRARVERVGRGDHSPTWAAFGHDFTDFWSRTAPPLIAARSAFLGRLAVDGTVIRAMFGSLWWLGPVAGVVLGGLAANQTNGHPLPPSTSLLIAVLVLSCFDAFAGFAASVVFGLLALSGLTAHGATVIIGVGFLWTALPFVGSMLRPFRRPGDGWRYRWDVLGDVVIAGVVTGWLAHELAASMNAFAGVATGIPTNSKLIGLVAGLAIGGRVLVEHLADVWWPERLRHTEVPDELPRPNALLSLGGVVVRVAVFAFVGHVFVGTCWQWVAGIVLMVLPDVVAVLIKKTEIYWPSSLPLPTGLTEILILVAAGTALVAAAVSHATGHTTALRDAFLVAALVPSALGIAKAVRGPDREIEPSSWELQLAGGGLVVTAVIFAVHGYSF